jgi:hypothetical protein
MHAAATVSHTHIVGCPLAHLLFDRSRFKDPYTAPLVAYCTMYSALIPVAVETALATCMLRLSESPQESGQDLLGTFDVAYDQTLRVDQLVPVVMDLMMYAWETFCVCNSVSIVVRAQPCACVVVDSLTTCVCAFVRMYLCACVLSSAARYDSPDLSRAAFGLLLNLYRPVAYVSTRKKSLKLVPAELVAQHRRVQLGAVVENRVLSPRSLTVQSALLMDSPLPPSPAAIRPLGSHLSAADFEELPLIMSPVANGDVGLIAGDVTSLPLMFDHVHEALAHTPRRAPGGSRVAAVDHAVGSEQDVFGFEAAQRM